MTMSPRYGDADGVLPGRAAGNDSTLVGAFLPRHSRLSAWIPESSPSTIASSVGGVETASAAAKTAFLTMVLALGRLRQRAERTTTSICTFFSWIGLRAGRFFSLSPRAGRGEALRRAAGRLLNLWSRAGAPRRPCRRRRRSAPRARGGPRPRR